VIPYRSTAVKEKAGNQMANVQLLKRERKKESKELRICVHCNGCVHCIIEAFLQGKERHLMTVLRQQQHQLNWIVPLKTLK
jgi:hypothetical protein